MHYQPLTKTTRHFHWAIATLILGLMIAGIAMVELEIWALYPIHKAIGVIALLVILPRVILRLKQGMPQPVSQQSMWQNKLATTAHWLLLISTFTMPVSGLLLSGFGGYGVEVFGLVLIPSQYGEQGAVAYNQYLSNLGAQIHTFNGYFLVALIALHILAAFKHHLFDKDATLLRMLGRT